ncbi:hypothetical protein PUN28_006841 [Cardiocondyla obscurior]|uniref:Uncharacterized protein n=1 Tax=Cardiocondyla obscurior TaxID=286306 RepID=A0AAW2G0I6_9HYME
MLYCHEDVNIRKYLLLNSNMSPPVRFPSPMNIMALRSREQQDINNFIFPLLLSPEQRDAVFPDKKINRPLHSFRPPLNRIREYTKNRTFPALNFRGLNAAGPKIQLLRRRVLTLTFANEPKNVGEKPTRIAQANNPTCKKSEQTAKSAVQREKKKINKKKKNGVGKTSSRKKHLA